MENQYYCDSEGVPFGEIGSKFVSAIEGFNFKQFDNLTPLLATLSHIKIKEGYVLDAFSVGSHLGSIMQLYACRSGSTFRYDPLESYHYKPFSREFEAEYRAEKFTIPEYHDYMYIECNLPRDIAETIPPFEQYLDMDFTAESIWEAFLIYLLPTYMPKGWHGRYMTKDYIFSEKDLREIDEIDCSKYYNSDLMTPKVTMTSDHSAVVNIAYFYLWGGLRIATVEVTKCDGVIHFNTKPWTTLIEYDCGICF